MVEHVITGSKLWTVEVEPQQTRGKEIAGSIARASFDACLKGENGRTKVKHWLPRLMAFPAGSYTDRAGFATAASWTRVESLFIQQ